jgi:hypothetical protein
MKITIETDYRMKVELTIPEDEDNPELTDVGDWAIRHVLKMIQPYSHMHPVNPYEDK